MNGIRVIPKNIHFVGSSSSPSNSPSCDTAVQRALPWELKDVVSWFYLFVHMIELLYLGAYPDF